MYLRFVVPGRVTRAGIQPGLFRDAYRLRNRLWADPLGFAIDQELAWFDDHLPLPRGAHPFSVRARRVWHRDGVCWFRPCREAGEAIAHAHVLAALLDDAGVQVDVLAARCPGTILYSDAIQVVAKPN